jgi:predicted ArsR family transcriptional regulator
MQRGGRTMNQFHWENDRTGGTRERIIRLLLAQPLTIAAMARRLGMTQNAVRAQVALLQREGVAEQQGEVKGARRPSILYGLLAGADAQLSRAYPLMVSHLVRLLSEELSSKEFEGIMKKLGRLLASAVPRATGDMTDRVKEAIRFLRALGSIAELTEENGRYMISSDGCPIGVAVAADIRACFSMEAMMRQLTGLEVVQECRHGTRSRCRFVVTPPRGRERRAVDPK